MNRKELIANLAERQMHTELYDECPEAVMTAVQHMAESLLCDLKFDKALFWEWFRRSGWTQEDLNYFGISQMFDDNKLTLNDFPINGSAIATIDGRVVWSNHESGDCPPDIAMMHVKNTYKINGELVIELTNEEE